MAILNVTGLGKKYGNSTKALSDISFSINKGEFVSIIGPSGAGKSTLLRCINRMIDSTEGKIDFDNVEVNSLRKKELRKHRTSVGMIFQHYNLVDRLSVFENVLHGRLGYKSTLSGMLSMYEESEKKQASEIIKKLGLENEIYKRCDELSGGQKQRVGIARALIQNPKLLLADEPIASLDPNASRVIMDYLKDINKEMGITCIVNLHQVDVALKYSDRIIGINSGKVVFDGKSDELTKERIHKIYGSEVGKLIID